MVKNYATKEKKTPHKQTQFCQTLHVKTPFYTVRNVRYIAFRMLYRFLKKIKQYRKNNKENNTNKVIMIMNSKKKKRHVRG